MQLHWPSILISLACAYIGLSLVKFVYSLEKEIVCMNCKYLIWIVNKTNEQEPHQKYQLRYASAILSNGFCQSGGINLGFCPYKTGVAYDKIASWIKYNKIEYVVTARALKSQTVRTFPEHVQPMMQPDDQFWLQQKWLWSFFVGHLQHWNQIADQPSISY